MKVWHFKFAFFFLHHLVSLWSVALVFWAVGPLIMFKHMQLKYQEFSYIF